MPKTWFSSTILDSGLRMVVAPMDSPSVTVVFMVKAGSKNEVPDQAGISHFLEHFVFRGTKEYPTSRDVMRALDSVGASHNAATGKEYTCYWVKAAVSQLQRAVELIGEIVFRPKLPEKLMDKEKGTIIQEIAMYDDHPMMKVASRFEELIFGKATPLGREIIGSKKTVSSLARRQLVDYRQRWYRPETTVFGVAGGVNKTEVLRYAERHFGNFDKPNKSEKTYKTDIQSPRQLSRRLIDSKKTDQVHLVVGLPGLKRRDQRRYALGVLSTILGGNASSQLFEEIREKRGLAYYIKASATRYEEIGHLAIRAGVPPKKATAVEQLIREHLSSFTFSRQELGDAKEYLKGQLSLEWENSQTIAGHLAEDYLFEPTIRSFAEIRTAIDRVNRSQVKALAQELFSDSQQVYVAAIGPVNDLLCYTSPQ